MFVCFVHAMNTDAYLLTLSSSALESIFLIILKHWSTLAPEIFYEYKRARCISARARGACFADGDPGAEGATGVRTAVYLTRGDR